MDDDLIIIDDLVAGGGIAAPVNWPSSLFVTEARPIHSALPAFTAPRGRIAYPVPGKGPLIGEALEQWERERERERRIRERTARIERDFCLCSRVNVGYDDGFEADWRRQLPPSGCPVHEEGEVDGWE